MMEEDPNTGSKGTEGTQQGKRRIQDEARDNAGAMTYPTSNANQLQGFKQSKDVICLWKDNSGCCGGNALEERNTSGEKRNLLLGDQGDQLTGGRYSSPGKSKDTTGWREVGSLE